jgi:hypothetical protein
MVVVGTGLMLAALILPRWLGGRAAIDAELQAEIRESEQLHEALEQAHGNGVSETDHEALHQQLSAAQAKLMQRVEQASQRGRTMVLVLRWCGIGLTAAGIAWLIKGRTE